MMAVHESQLARSACWHEETPMSHVADEIASQPDVWAEASDRIAELGAALPTPGQRVAATGCGTSWHVARTYAALREAGGAGETDHFATSELPFGRSYDRVLALSRSGTTTEVLHALERLSGRVPTVAVTADPDSPIVDLADEVIVLDFADEQSVVQTRFATTAVALLRRHLGDDLEDLLRDGRRALTETLPDEAVAAEQVTFLGSGWSYGLAEEAALKLRETAGAWAEAYPNLEYRHGPISIAAPGRCTWFLGPVADDLVADVRRTGVSVVTAELDPLAELVRAQRVAVARAERAGLDPDRPRHLTRSVILG
jgi:fructoselysine-6-P-deglycase FrlB-like protein